MIKMNDIAMVTEKLGKPLGMEATDPTKNLNWYNAEIEETKQTYSIPVVLIEQHADFSRWWNKALVHLIPFSSATAPCTQLTTNIVLESSCPLKKSTERINGVVATIMGFGRAILCKNNTGAPVYDDREILSYKNGALVSHKKLHYCLFI